MIRCRRILEKFVCQYSKYKSVMFVTKGIVRRYTERLAFSLEVLILLKLHSPKKKKNTGLPTSVSSEAEVFNEKSAMQGKKQLPRLPRYLNILGPGQKSNFTCAELNSVN